MHRFFQLYILLFVFGFKTNLSLGQIKVIDHKGTFTLVDSSKWTISGTNIFNKNSGNIGIGNTNPQAKLHTTGTLRFEGLGTNTINSNVLTTNATGDVTLRSISSFLTGNTITALNGLTNSSQTFATGTAGSNFNIVSAGSAHTFNLPSASSANRGLLTSADWTIFNNKENAIAAGTVGQYWRGDKTWQTLNTSVVPESGNLYFTNARARDALSITTLGNNGAATYNSTTGVFNIPNYTLAGLGGITLTSLSATAPLSYNNTTGVFSITQSNASTSGFLSSTDWNTFNNKIGSIIGTAPITASTIGSTTTVGITRNNIVSGTSSNIATSALTLDAGATNAVVGGANATVTVNNTAPLWNANQLQGRNISSTAPIEGQFLGWDATTSTWIPSGYTVKTVATTTYTILASDHGKILDFTSNSAITLTVPNTLTTGFQVSITQAGTGQITITGGAGMTVNNRWGGTRTSGRWAKAGVEVRAAGSSVLSGDVL